MNTQIIGIKKLHKNLKQISEATLDGQSFLVVKNSKPVFKIQPIDDVKLKKKKYKLDDLWKIRFENKDKNLSKKIDKILYTA